MKVLASLCLLLSVAATSLGQVPDFYKPGAPPARIAIADLPDDYHAMEVRFSSASGLGEMFSGPLGMLMFSGGMGRGDSANEMAGMRILGLSQIVFFKGDLSAITAPGAGSFMAYTLAIGPENAQEIIEGHAKPEFQFIVIRTDSVKAFVPRPDITKASLIQMFAGPPKPNMSDQKTATLSNFKQMALGMTLYSSDSDDVYPYVQDSKSALALIMPYCKNREIMRSLNADSEVRFNMAVAGVNVSEIASPAETPLFYESAAWPDGTRCVAFTDAHAKFVDATEWERLQAALRLKMKRTAKPLPPFYWKQLHFDDLPGPGAGTATPAHAPPPPERVVPAKGGGKHH